MGGMRLKSDSYYSAILCGRIFKADEYVSQYKLFHARSGISFILYFYKKIHDMFIVIYCQGRKIGIVCGNINIIFFYEIRYSFYTENFHQLIEF